MAVTRTPQHQRRARTRAALLLAAGKVFAARGYHGATLEEVLTEAGVSKGALYHYFRSKEELFLALLEETLADRLNEADAVVADRVAEQSAIGAAADEFLQGVTRDPRWLPLLLEFLAYGSRDSAARERVVERFMRPARERIAAILEQAGADKSLISVDELAVAGAALINGLAIERAFDPDAVPDDLPGRLLGVIAAGLSAVEAHPWDAR